MSTRWKRSIGALSVILVLLVFAGIAYVRSPRSQPVEVVFLDYTNSAAGGLSAALEIRNRSKERIARNSCRVHPEPADAGYWYAANVPSHRLEADESERLVVAFEPRPITRWRATINYVRNPTAIEFRLISGVDWLSSHGWAPSALREWRDRLTGGQASTEWIMAPVTNRAPNKSVETNRRPASPFEAGRQSESVACAPPFLSAAVAHLWRWTPMPQPFLCRCLVLLLAILMSGCGRSGWQLQPGELLKIAVFEDGRILVDGRPSTLEDLERYIKEQWSSLKLVGIYRERQTEVTEELGFQVLNQVLEMAREHHLSCRLAILPDYSDLLLSREDQNKLIHRLHYERLLRESASNQSSQATAAPRLDSDQSR